ncbi:MAG: hypothetical protein ACOCVF_02630 [bacterium]
MNSIYTQKDIDCILDKGSENWNKSDIKIMKSYATSDKELKDIINIMKSYKDKFIELNKKISNEKIYPKNLLQTWTKLNSELFTYERILQEDYKILELKKLDRLKLYE